MEVDTVRFVFDDWCPLHRYMILNAVEKERERERVEKQKTGREIKGNKNNTRSMNAKQDLVQEARVLCDQNRQKSKPQK